MRFLAGTTDVPTAGTAVQIKNTSDRVLWAKFRNPNAGAIYIGVSDVSATNGYQLRNQDDELVVDFATAGGSVLASTLYADVATNGFDVAWAMILA